MPAVEIDSSFHRPHRPATYARWAGSVPPGFRFAIKLPRSVTHDARLCGADDALNRFLGEVSALGDRLRPLLVQLAPSLRFDGAVAAAFFTGLRWRFAGPVVCEPRHRSWFTPVADGLLVDHRVARVAADPAVVPAAAEPGGWDGLTYRRLHGSPEIYRSAYDPAFLDTLARRLEEEAGRGAVWCVFDNTADGHALPNALRVGRAAGLF